MSLRLVCVVVLGIGITSSGCSTMEQILPQRQPDYQQSRPAPTLDVPPDLNPIVPDEESAIPAAGSDTATFSEYNDAAPEQTQAAARVLPEFDTVRVEREGDRRWLVIDAVPDQVWDKVRAFWTQAGFPLKSEDARTGIIETGWVENRADIPLDPIRKMINKVLGSLYSAPTRDKFRLRLEAGKKPGTTEVYITHTGMAEVVQGQGTLWQARPRDPELEAEMQRRLLVFLGVKEQQATQRQAAAADDAVRAELQQSDGTTALVLNEDFSRAWRSVGLALDRAGLAVEDKDRSAGVYYVHYADPETKSEKGWLSKLAFWSDDDDEATDTENRYQVKLQASDAATRVTILDQQGKNENSATGKRLLTLLQEHMR